MADTITNLSHWFPLIEAAGLPVPKTKIIQADEKVTADLWEAFDGKPGELPAFSAFIEKMRVESEAFEAPFFLRTGFFSGKHRFEECCLVTDRSKLGQHIYNIAEFSEICGMFGELPFDTWVLREYLPVTPVGYCPEYGNMPVVKEFRVFVNGDQPICIHPYWPLKALQQGGATGIDFEALCNTFGQTPELLQLACAAGKTVGGKWSVDILQTKRGWYITDMAEAQKSFHWEGCPYEPDCHP